MVMDAFDNRTVRASLFFFVIVVIGLPMWVLLLFPTQIEEYLISPVLWGFVIGTWLTSDNFFLTRLLIYW